MICSLIDQNVTHHRGGPGLQPVFHYPDFEDAGNQLPKLQPSPPLSVSN